MRRWLLAAILVLLAPIAYAQLQTPGLQGATYLILGPYAWITGTAGSTNPSQITMPAGTHTLAGVDSPIAGFNAQTGTTYMIAASDMGKIVSMSNGSAIAVTLPQAGTTGFEANTCFMLVDLGAGTATVTPTTSTINGGATKAYATGVGGKICSNGTNYLAY